MYFCLLILSGFWAIGFVSCDDNDSATIYGDAKDENYGTKVGRINYSPGEVIVLAVDYTTNSFLGGYTIPVQNTDGSFAIESDYKSPGDFGRVAFYEKGSHTRLFEGSIVWAGSGRREYPEEMFSPESFAVTGKIRLWPKFTLYDYSAGEISDEAYDFSPVRYSINRLEIVRQAIQRVPGAPIYASLYRRSVGIGNPADWYWLIFIRG